MQYVIGRRWVDENPQLYKESDGICVYSYGSQVHAGTIEEARKFRDRISKREGKKYNIYILSSEPIE